MLVCWLVSFCFGLFLSQNFASLARCFTYTPEIMPIVLAFLFVLKRKQGSFCRLIVIGLGLIWGLMHSAPLPDRSVSNVRVIRAGFTPHHRTNLIVRQDSFVWRVYGKAVKNTVGKILCRKNSGFCYFKPALYPETSKDKNLFFRTGDSLKALLKYRMRQFPSRLRGWLESILLGERRNLDYHLKRLFKTIGCYHLLVVSGLHVAALAFLVGWLFRCPAQLAYALCLVSPKTWYWYGVLMDVGLFTLMVLLICINDFSPAVLRASLIFGVFRASPYLCASSRITDRILISLCGYSLICPTMFFTYGAILSWTAFIFCVGAVRFVSKRERSWYWIVLGYFGLQVVLQVLSGVVLGSFSLSGIVLNGLLVPAFTVVMAAAIALLVSGRLLGWAFDLQYQFWTFAEKSALWFGEFLSSWNLGQLVELSGQWRDLLGGCIIFLLFRTFVNLDGISERR